MADNAKIALYQHTPGKRGPEGRTPDTNTLLEVRDLGAPRAEILRRRRWKDAITAQLRSEGWTVHALSVAAAGSGPEFVVYLERPTPEAALGRRRPVTLHGRPLTGPDLSQPSMAARLRRGR